MIGRVTWCDIKKGHGLIACNCSSENILVQNTAITRNTLLNTKRSVREGETVEFLVVEETKGTEVANITGPGDGPMQGSPFAVDRRLLRIRWFPRQYYHLPEFGTPSGPDQDDRREVAETQ